jgi:hypothetical protein
MSVVHVGWSALRKRLARNVCMHNIWAREQPWHGNTFRLGCQSVCSWIRSPPSQSVMQRLYEHCRPPSHYKTAGTSICATGMFWTNSKKVKVKLSPCLTKSALRHEGVGGSGCIDPHFLDLGSIIENQPTVLHYIYIYIYIYCSM